MSVYDVIVEVGKVRLCFIMMILVLIILGGFFLIFFIGVGVEVCNVIGWVVFGGLGIVVVFILYLILVFYLVFVWFIKFRVDEIDWLECEMEVVGEYV